MTLLENLLADDPATPRFTIYDESAGTRMDFSAATLSNWAAKVANMLVDELDLEPGSSALGSSALGTPGQTTTAAPVLIDLPAGWQAPVVVLGCLTAPVPVHFAGPGTGSPAAVFTSLERSPAWNDAGCDVVIVTDDPFGRGVEECGLELPLGAIDFGPTVRSFPDSYPSPGPTLPELFPATTEQTGPARLLAPAWTDDASFRALVLEPLAAGGSTVVVVGPASAARLDTIATAEKATDRCL